jgi:hypothetical protein
MYDAITLLSIVNFWGEDITPEQEIWLMNESDDLPRNEQEKFLDLYQGTNDNGQGSMAKNHVN